MSFLQQFREVFGDDIPEGVEQHKIRCIWHDETAPSLTLYIEKGDYHCYGCGRDGKISDLIEAEDPVIDRAEIVRLHDQLMKEPAVVQFLTTIRGLTMETVREHLLGYNGTRIAIPVFNENGQCVNVRLYKPGGRGGDKIISYGKGYGKVRVYPCPPKSNQEEVILTEGEMDCLLARQMGLPAFTTTGGAKAWNESLTRHMFGRHVALIYDTDREGRAGAKAIVEHLKICTQSVRNVVLPTSSSSKDFTEWICQDGGSVETLRSLISATPPYLKSKVNLDLKDSIVLPLWLTSHAEYAFRAVETDVVIAGKDRAPYLVPERFSIDCDKDSKACCVCPNAAGPKEYALSWTDGSILQIVDCKEDVKWPKIRSMLGIPKQCRSAKASVLTYQNVETLALYPKAEWEGAGTETDERHCVRKGYFLGTGIQTNSAYRVKGITVPDAKDQTSVLILVQVTPLTRDVSDNIDLALLEKFRLTSRDSTPSSPKSSPESMDAAT